VKLQTLLREVNQEKKWKNKKLRVEMISWIAHENDFVWSTLLLDGVAVLVDVLTVRR
jgi:hypothetical protein